MSARKNPSLLDEAPEFIKWPVPSFESIKPDLDFGITEAHIWQDGRCGVCGRHEANARKNHAVDHDHETGLVRGLLCTGCNLQEGWQPNYRFAMWRGGLNPCAIFGWHYLYQGPGYRLKPLHYTEAEGLVRLAAVREELSRRATAEALREWNKSPQANAFLDAALGQTQAN